MLPGYFLKFSVNVGKLQCCEEQAYNCVQLKINLLYV